MPPEGGEATDLVSDADRHRFSSFSFPTIPVGATITGVEAVLDAWATDTGGVATTANLTPTAAGISTDWVQNTGSSVTAVQTNDGSTSYIAPTPQQQTYVLQNAGVPTGSTITSVTLHVVAQGVGNSIQLMAENGSNQSVDPTVRALTNSYTDYTYTFPTAPGGGVWTSTEVNNWTTRFGIQNTLGTTARVTQVFAVVGYTQNVSTNAQRAPAIALGSPNNQWNSQSNAFVSDNVYATDNTNNHAQGYGNFGFSIPSNASITGILVSAEAKVSGAASTNTATLTPNGQGSDTGWNGDETDLDETGTVSCSSGNRIDSTSSNARESVNIDLTSLPDGSTVTSVQVFTWDQGSPTGGVYQPFVRVNGGTPTQGSNTNTSSTNGCNARSQTIDIPDFIKTGTSDLEVGVQKIGTTQVQVGAIRAVVMYTPPPTGSLQVSLSSNNGSSWTTAPRVAALTATEAVVTPSGNSLTDTWGRTWVPADFNNGSFALRLVNTSGSATVSLDQVVVTVYYSTPTVGTTANLTPTAAGISTDWVQNTGSSVTAVQTNDGSTSYIAPTPQQQTYVLQNAGVPTGSTITSVTLHVVAQGVGNSIQLMAENGSNQSVDPTVRALTNSYTDYTYTFPTAPGGGVWTSTEVNNWTTRFGIQNTLGTTARVTQVFAVVGYTTPPLTSCSLGVDLSWNGGTTWTNEKTQGVTGTSATYTLGSQSDTWGRTWSSNDFTNTNFRARIHAIDPGSSCGTNAIDRVDWIRLRVTYSSPADATALALAAANDAKQPGGTDGLPVTIFAIHYGDASGQSLMSSLSTQNTVAKGISTAARSGSTVTITTSTAHGFIKGNRVTIAGVGNNALNGSFVITGTPTPSTFTYTTSSSGTVNTSGGTATTNKNFFVSPTSADMQAIFQAIGAAVCPAAAAQCANTGDDDGDGFVDASDPGCHTDGNGANAATYDATDNDEWEPVPTPPVPPPPPPPPSVQLGSWKEVPTLP